MTGGPSANGKQMDRRLRWPRHLPQPRKGDVPYAKRRLELKDVLEAEHAVLMRESNAWQALMRPVCHKLDKERSKRGQKFLYSSEELSTDAAAA